MALPPPPIQAQSGEFIWVDWYNSLSAYLTNGNSIPWSVINKAGSLLTDIATRTHVMLQSVQGGNATEQYHLTAAQSTDLTAGFTGTGVIVRQTSPTLITPVLGVATSTSLSLSGTLTPSTTAGIVGTTLADNANAGSIGEFITSTVNSLGITSNTLTNVTSISLTAGDWDVYGVLGLTAAGGAALTNSAGGSSTVSVTFGGTGTYWQLQSTLTANAIIFQSIPTSRLNLNSTTTVYLVTLGAFTAGTCTASGTLSARRVR